MGECDPIPGSELLFARVGYIEEKDRRTNVDDLTYGFGVAAPFRSLGIRFDYARRHHNGADTTDKRYALVLDVGL